MTRESGQSITHSLNDWNIAAAVQNAQKADVAIVFASSNSGEMYIIIDGNQGDRNNLSLWNNGDKLVCFIIIFLFIFN